MKERVLVTGIGGPAGRSAATFFRGKRYPVIGTDVRDVDVPTEVFRKLPLSVDPLFADSLLGVIRELGPALFVPTVTEELEVVAEIKGRIEALGCEVFISPPASVRIANDKLRTARFMEENKLAVPRTFAGDAKKEEVLKALGLPLLAKPSFGRGGRGVVLYMTREELLSEKREGIIFQEFIPGEEFDVNLFVGRGGLVRAAVALKKTEMKEGIVGNAVAVERAVREDAVAMCVRAAELLKLEGPLDFDVRLRKDNTPALLEINARLGGNSLSAVEVLESLLAEFLALRARRRPAQEGRV